MGAREIDNRVVVEPPTAPRSSEWKQRLVVGLVASLGGLLLGVFLAGLREFFDQRLADAAMVTAYLDLPVLGVLPQLDEREREAALDVPALLARLRAPS
jgi:capsular polysaccharide biosynthesis protein